MPLRRKPYAKVQNFSAESERKRSLRTKWRPPFVEEHGGRSPTSLLGSRDKGSRSAFPLPTPPLRGGTSEAFPDSAYAFLSLPSFVLAGLERKSRGWRLPPFSKHGFHLRHRCLLFPRPRVFLRVWIYYDRRDHALFEAERRKLTFHCIRCGQLYTAKPAEGPRLPARGHTNTRLRSEQGKKKPRRLIAAE